MMTAATPVHHREGVSPRIKSLNYLAHILAKVEAIAAGADEALMLEAGSGVSEGVGENVFCVRARTVVTPPAYAGILRGITRDAVLEIAAAARYDIRESNLTRYELFTSDEMFLTGTAAEIVGVVKLDGRVIGTGQVGPVTRDLAARFKELVAREA
jgi:branched-chain amino acid aminotransferase